MQRFCNVNSYKFNFKSQTLMYNLDWPKFKFPAEFYLFILSIERNLVMSHIRRNFNLLEWAIYLAERESLLRHRATESEERDPSLEPGALSALEANLSNLLHKLSSKDQRVRRQVAKELGEVDHPDAAKALVRLLQDEDHTVRWTAMGSLTNLRRSAMRPLMEALTQNFQSARLREGAHHVLRTLHDYGSLTVEELEVYHALEGTAPGIQAAWAANNALIGYQASPGS
jgi:hypothetical protein